MNRNLCGIAAHWYGKAAAQGDEEAGARPCEPATATSRHVGRGGSTPGRTGGCPVSILLLLLLLIIIISSTPTSFLVHACIPFPVIAYSGK